MMSPFRLGSSRSFRLAIGFLTRSVRYPHMSAARFSGAVTGRPWRSFVQKRSGTSFRFGRSPSGSSQSSWIIPFQTGSQAATMSYLT